METRSGVKGILCNGVFFTEESIPSASVLKHVQVEISRQNSNLAEVKDRLARETLFLGGSAIMNFRYGQRAHKWWELVFTLKWDTESWHGEGDAIKI